MSLSEHDCCTETLRGGVGRPNRLALIDEEAQVLFKLLVNPFRLPICLG